MSWPRPGHRSRLDKRWQIAAAALLLVLVLAAWSFGPLVRAVAVARARTRGVELEIGGVRPGWFAVQLRDTVARLSGVPSLQVKLERVDVRVTPWLALDEVEVLRGEISLEGSPELVLEQLRAWRKARPSPSGSGGGSAARLPLRGAGLSVRWAKMDGAEAVQTLSGLFFERGERTRAGFESARLELAGGAWEVHRAAAELSETPEGPALVSARAQQVVGRVLLGSPRPSGAAPGAAAGDDELAAIRRTRSDAALPDDPEDVSGRSSPAPTAEPAGASRWVASLASQSWERRGEQLRRVRRLAARAVAGGAHVEFDRVQLELTRGTSVLNIGPAPFRLERQGDRISVSLTPPAQKNDRQLSITGQLPLGEAPVEVSLEGGPISLETLGVREGDFGLLGVDQSELTLATRLSLSPEGVLGVSASGRLGQLGLQHPALAPEPLRDMDLGWSGEIALDLARHKLEIKDGVVSVERVRAEFGAALESNGSDLRVALSLVVPPTPCKDLFAAAPPALLPQLEGLRLGGAFALDSRVEFDTAAPKDARVDWNLHNACKVLETPEAVDPQRFREPFQHTVMDAQGKPIEIPTGPTTPQWVPLSDISPHMETALIVCEDSRFFSHKGFDDKAIRDSIGDNLRAGHFVRGASTLSMQLAKNLYLGREKTLSRKLQEAVFTMLLEERLSKEDILELYLNVVEFGPGIYGIRDAAMHYFNSHPGELSLGQALYLGSVLPRPKANHFQPDGALRRRWAEHLQYLMRIARKIQRISDDELEAGLNEQIVFGKAQPNSNAEFLFGIPLDLNDG